MKKITIAKSSLALTLILTLLSFNQATASDARVACPAAEAGAATLGAAGAGLGGTLGFKLGSLACGAFTLFTAGVGAAACPAIIAAGTVGGSVLGAVTTAPAGHAIGAEFDGEGCKQY